MYVRWTEKYTAIVHEEYFEFQHSIEKRVEELRSNPIVACVELTMFALCK